MEEEKRPVGRPRTTLNDLPDNWEEIITTLSQEGASNVEIMCMLGIQRSAFKTLKKDFPEFCAAVKRGKLLCEAWWERRGRDMAMGADGNPTVWIFNMKNRFEWRDKSEVDNKHEHSGKIDSSWSFNNVAKPSQEDASS